MKRRYERVNEPSLKIPFRFSSDYIASSPPLDANVSPPPPQTEGQNLTSNHKTYFQTCSHLFQLSLPSTSSNPSTASTQSFTKISNSSQVQLSINSLSASEVAEEAEVGVWDFACCQALR